jgi:hypothetical protein
MLPHGRQMFLVSLEITVCVVNYNYCSIALITHVALQQWLIEQQSTTNIQPPKEAKVAQCLSSLVNIRSKLAGSTASLTKRDRKEA